MCHHMRLDRLFMNERSINKTRPLTALLQSSFLFRESRYQISLCVLFTDSPFNTEFQFRFLCHSRNYPLNLHCFQRRLTSIKLKICCDVLSCGEYLQKCLVKILTEFLHILVILEINFCTESLHVFITLR